MVGLGLVVQKKSVWGWDVGCAGAGLENSEKSPKSLLGCAGAGLPKSSIFAAAAGALLSVGGPSKLKSLLPKSKSLDVVAVVSVC